MKFITYLIATFAILLFVLASYLGFWHYTNRPKNLVVSEGQGSLIVKWDNVTSLGLSHYQVHREETKSGNQTLLTNGLKSNTIEDVSARAGEKYLYKISAVSIGGFKSKVTTSSEGSWSPPEEPSNAKLSIKGDIIEISWDKANENDVAGYDIYQSVEENRLGHKINPDIVSGSFYQFRDTAINPFDYYYRVKVRDISGNESSESQQAVFAISALPEEQTCLQPTDCTTIRTSCPGCECGAPVHKRYAQQYINQHASVCREYSGFECTDKCQTPYVACLDYTCSLTDLRGSLGVPINRNYKEVFGVEYANTFNTFEGTVTSIGEFSNNDFRLRKVQGVLSSPLKYDEFTTYSICGIRTDQFPIATNQSLRVAYEKKRSDIPFVYAIDRTDQCFSTESEILDILNSDAMKARTSPDSDIRDHSAVFGNSSLGGRFLIHRGTILQSSVYNPVHLFTIQDERGGTRSFRADPQTVYFQCGEESSSFFLKNKQPVQVAYIPNESKAPFVHAVDLLVGCEGASDTSSPKPLYAKSITDAQTDHVPLTELATNMYFVYGATKGQGGISYGMILGSNIYSDSTNRPTSETPLAAHLVATTFPQIVVLTTNEKEITVYFPSNSGKRRCYYIADDGSTYHATKDHGECIKSDMTPWEAMKPEHLARQAP